MAYAQKLSKNRHLDLLARDKDHARDILPCHDNYFRQMILKSYSYEPERKHVLLLPLHKVYVSSVTLTLSQRHGFAFNTFVVDKSRFYCHVLLSINNINLFLVF